MRFFFFKTTIMLYLAFKILYFYEKRLLDIIHFFTIFRIFIYVLSSLWPYFGIPYPAINALSTTYQHLFTNLSTELSTIIHALFLLFSFVLCNFQTLFLSTNKYMFKKLWITQFFYLFFIPSVDFCRNKRSSLFAVLKIFVPIRKYRAFYISIILIRKIGYVE